MLTKDQVLRIAENIHGWCSTDELSWLYNRATKLPSGSTWVEVGCFKGRSLAPAALANPDLFVYAVDSFEGHVKSPTWGECVVGDWVADHIRSLSKLANATGYRYINMTRRDSLSAADYFSHLVEWSGFDVCYLDQDWRDGPDYVERVVRAWLPLVKPGGLVCGRNHGIDPKVGGLGDWMVKMLPGMTNPVGSVWSWRKPK